MLPLASASAVARSNGAEGGAVASLMRRPNASRCEGGGGSSFTPKPPGACRTTTPVRARGGRSTTTRCTATRAPTGSGLALRTKKPPWDRSFT